MPVTATQRNGRPPAGTVRRRSTRATGMPGSAAVERNSTRVPGRNGHRSGARPRLLPGSRRVAPDARLLSATTLNVWHEALAGLDWVSLRTSGVYYGFGVPHGHGEPVVVVPGFLGTDRYLMEMYHWLQRVGYTPYYSGIGRNTECPDLLTQRLTRTVRRAYRETGERVTLVGHSLGGTLSRVVANQHPQWVARVITLGSPLAFARVHPLVLAAARRVKHRIDDQHHAEGKPRPSTCYTDGCTCSFVSSVLEGPPASVPTSSIYTRADGIVDWHCCVERDGTRNIEVKGTHFGLAFNPQVFREVARLLAEPVARSAPGARRSNGRAARCPAG